MSDGEKIEWGTYTQLLENHSEEFEALTYRGWVRQFSAWSVGAGSFEAESATRSYHAMFKRKDRHDIPEHHFFLLNNAGEFTHQMTRQSWTHQVSAWNDHLAEDMSAQHMYRNLFKFESPLIKEADPELERLLAEEDSIEADRALHQAQINAREARQRMHLWQVKCGGPEPTAPKYIERGPFRGAESMDLEGYADVLHGMNLPVEAASWGGVAEALRENIVTYPIVDKADEVFPDREPQYCVFFKTEDAKLYHSDGESWTFKAILVPDEENADKAHRVEVLFDLSEDAVFSMLQEGTEDIIRTQLQRAKEGRPILTSGEEEEEETFVKVAGWEYDLQGVKRAEITKKKLILDY